MQPRGDRAVLAMFGLMVLLGGSNSVAVRFSNQELPPFWGAALRFGLAALLFAVLMLALRREWPRGRALGGAVLYGVLGFGAAYALVYWGLVFVGAGPTQVIMAVVPLLTLGLAMAHRLERFRWRTLAGGLVSVAGIALVFGDQLGGATPLLPLLAIVGTAVCAAEAGVLAKLFPRTDPLAANAIGMATGAAINLALSLALAEPHALPARRTTWLALGFLVLVGSLAVFWLYLTVLRHWSASATSFQFVLLPFVTVVVAAALLREPVRLVFALGGALVLAGVYVGALARDGPAPVAPPAAAEEGPG